MKNVIKGLIIAVLSFCSYGFSQAEMPKKEDDKTNSYDRPAYCPNCQSWHIPGCCPKEYK